PSKQALSPVVCCLFSVPSATANEATERTPMPPTTSQTHPMRLADLEPSWIETLLRQAGSSANPAIKNIDVQRIGEGVGFLGELGRINIQYADDNVAHPRSLIAKFSSPDAGVRQF